MDVFRDKIKWSVQSDPEIWVRNGDSFHFPCAEYFLKNWPWLTVRIFCLIIRVKKCFAVFLGSYER